MKRVLLAVAALTCALFPPMAWAAETGPVTNLPLPRFVSLKASEGNVRRGPSLNHRIDWVFKHRHMPLEVTGEYGHWRRVRDRDGAGGWVHYSLLSGNRTVIVETDMLPLLMKPDPGAPINAQIERGVIAHLDRCAEGWCRVEAGRYRGWVPQNALWGASPSSSQDPQAAE